MFDYNPKEFRILIVDDDKLVLEGLRVLLEDTYNLIAATSGPEAIELVQKENSIAVVVMDIKMPQMDGIETARRLREFAPDIPVIFHTGFSGKYDEDRIDSDEKPYQYVQKGGSPSQLTRAVRNALDSYVTKTQMHRLSASPSEFRRSCIIEALLQAEGNVNAAARYLGVDPASLRKWIKAYDIQSA